MSKMVLVERPTTVTVRVWGQDRNGKNTTNQFKVVGADVNEVTAVLKLAIIEHTKRELRGQNADQAQAR